MDSLGTKRVDQFLVCLMREILKLQSKYKNKMISMMWWGNSKTANLLSPCRIRYVKISPTHTPPWILGWHFGIFDAVDNNWKNNVEKWFELVWTTQWLTQLKAFCWIDEAKGHKYEKLNHKHRIIHCDKLWISVKMETDCFELHWLFIQNLLKHMVLSANQKHDVHLYLYTQEHELNWIDFYI